MRRREGTAEGTGRLATLTLCGGLDVSGASSSAASCLCAHAHPHTHTRARVYHPMAMCAEGPSLTQC